MQVRPLKNIRSVVLSVCLLSVVACRREGEPLFTPPPGPTAAEAPASPLRELLVPSVGSADAGSTPEPTPAVEPVQGTAPTPTPTQPPQPDPNAPMAPPIPTGERVHVAHLLVMHTTSQMRPPTVTRTLAEARTLATQLLGRIRRGEDLVALARQFSDEPGHEQKGGDLGYITRGMTVAPFDAAAFALRVGQVSDVVQTDFGFHIIRRIE